MFPFCLNLLKLVSLLLPTLEQICLIIHTDFTNQKIFLLSSVIVLLVNVCIICKCTIWITYKSRRALFSPFDPSLSQCQQYSTDPKPSCCKQNYLDRSKEADPLLCRPQEWVRPFSCLSKPGWCCHTCNCSLQ